MDGVRREVARRGRTPTEWPALTDDEFANFFSQYGRDHPQAWKTVSFADGGYLNNRPVDLVMETLEALAEERGSEEKIWGSMVKQTLKRRRPGFNESYYGFRSFNRLLEEAASRGLMDLDSDEKSGGYIISSFNPED